jgi:hypothetical protein
MCIDLGEKEESRKSQDSKVVNDNQQCCFKQLVMVIQYASPCWTIKSN